MNIKNKEFGRKEKAYINFIASIINQLFTFAYGIVIPRLIILQYGSELNGVASSITQFLGYFALITAGIQGAGIFALYGPLAEKNKEKINKVLATIGHEYYKCGLIITGLCIIFSFIYPYFVEVKSISKTELILLIMVLSSYSLLDMFTVAKAATLVAAEQKAFLGTTINIFVTIINFILTILTIKLQLPYIFVKISTLLAFIFRAVCFSYVVKKYFPYFDNKIKPDKLVIPQRGSAMFLQILGLIHSSTAVILLTVINKDLKEISVYSIYNGMLGQLSVVVGFIITAIGPAFGNIVAQKDKDLLKKSFSLYEYFFLMINTIIFSSILLVFIPFIKLYTNDITDTNYVRPLVALLFAFNGFLFNIKSPAGLMITSAGFFKQTRVQTAIQGAINLIISLILVKPLGIVGCLIGAIASNIYRDIDLLYFTPKYITKTNILKSYIRAIRSIILFIIIILPSYFFDFSVSNYYFWLGELIIAVIWASILVLLFNLLFEKNEFVNLLRTLKIIK